MKRTYNPKNVRRKSNEKRTFNKPKEVEKERDLKIKPKEVEKKKKDKK